MSHASSPTLNLTLAEALAAELAQHAHRIFGLMGNGNAHVIDALTRLGVPYTAVRHEQATVASADAFTRVSGKLAIATTTYGAGFTNTLTALAEAAQARTPMLVVVGDAPAAGPRPWDVDQEMLTAALGVKLYQLSPTGLRGQVQRAVAYSLRTRKPVVLGVPYDLVKHPVEDGEPQRTDAPLELNSPGLIASLAASVAGVAGAGNGEVEAAHPAQGALDTLAIERAAALLAGAQRPLVLAGRGAHLAGAHEALDELHQLVGGATASTALARGIFAEHSTHLGVAGGFGQEAAMQLIETCDVVLAVGASLNQFTMRFGELIGDHATVIRVDIDQVQAPLGVADERHLLVQGDAREVLGVLTQHLRDEGPAGQSGHSADFTREVTEGVGSGRLTERPTGLDAGGGSGLCADGRLDPRAVASVIAASLPRGAFVAQDGGHFIAWANMFFDIASPERMTMVGTAYQSIGLGFGSVPGVAHAAGRDTVVLSTGDGGGLMALPDLESAIRESESLVILVWNDAAYGAEVHLYGVMGLDEAPMRIPEVNFAALAEAMGARGVTVRTLDDLRALDEWRDAGARGTLLLDCRVSSTVVAPYQREVQRVNGL